MSESAATTGSRLWESLVCSIGFALGVGDYHILGGSPFHAPHGVALGLAIFIGAWAPVALRLRHV